MKYTYEEILENGVLVSITRTDENGKVWSIPADPANSDYQAYLNKDKPQVEHLTEIVPTNE